MRVPYLFSASLLCFRVRRERKRTTAIRNRTICIIRDHRNRKKLIPLLQGFISMIKLLIILALSIYVISKLSGFLFRVGAASQNRNQRKPDGSIHVDPNQKKDRHGNIKDGD